MTVHAPNRESADDGLLSPLEREQLRLALARLPNRLHRACETFQQLTGLTAVVSSDVDGGGEVREIPPPVHPRCAALLAGTVEPPCDGTWRQYVRERLRTRRGHCHACALGLRCACLPIHLGDAWVGVAKVVAESDSCPVDFSAATATLALAIDTSCQETLFSLLVDELAVLRRRAAAFRCVLDDGVRTRGTDAEPPERVPGDGRLVSRAIDFLHRHHADPALRLSSVASALGCNPNYLTQRFTEIVGRRMRSYIVSLRVGRACRQLLNTELSVKRIALESGFGDPGSLSRAFRGAVGVSPSEYRRIFSARGPVA